MTVQEALSWPPLVAALWVVLGFLVIRLLSRLVHRRLGRTHAHYALIGRTVVVYVGFVVIVIGAARALGVDLTALLATAGILTVAVGFAAQTSLSNLIAGVFLLVDRPFEVGDTIEVEARLGVVQEVTLLSTFVRTFDNILVRWPNEVVLKATILNYTRYPVRRVDLRFALAFGTDLEAARAAVVEALAHSPVVMLDPQPEVVLRGFLDRGVEVEVRAWVPQPEFLRGRNDVVRITDEALRAAGVAFALPQLTIWRGDVPAHPGSER